MELTDKISIYCGFLSTPLISLINRRRLVANNTIIFRNENT